MIGVIADPADHAVVREFFELFKIPWEFFRGNCRYEVVLCTRDVPQDVAAKLVLVYAGRKTSWDDGRKIPTGPQPGRSCVLLFQGDQIPVYGDTITFKGKGSDLLTERVSGESAAFVDRSEGCVVARIGYDLFREVRTLLSEGQPKVYAHVPSLELHIALLRQIITGCGIPLVEIPPVPEGYQFIVCLTHDVDHPSLRVHHWDHTMIGFLIRAVFVSFWDLVRGRISFQDLFANWNAAWKLPFIHLGLAKDFWGNFDDRYLELERNLPSTFFMIPRKDYAGLVKHGAAPGLRAVRYEARELEGAVRKLKAAGREVGLHGIDAWLDSSKGSEELDEIRRLTRDADVGVRMHWLFYDQQSPALLEKAGAAYDSTIGYNETVGYRAGTAQAYKPLEAEGMLELPMHVMDTALFYLSYLGLSPRGAMERLAPMIAYAVRFGGCLTINWHDRSLAPERLWGPTYRNLLRELQDRNAWFANAGDAVTWFKKRRSAMFETDASEPGSMHVRLAGDYDPNLPGLRLRTHKPRVLGTLGQPGEEDCIDVPVEEGVAAGVPVSRER